MRKAERHRDGDKEVGGGRRQRRERERRKIREKER